MLRPRLLDYKEHIQKIVQDVEAENEPGARLFIEKPFRPRRIVPKIVNFLKKNKITGMLVFEVEEGITKKQFLPILNKILKKSHLSPDTVKIHVIFDVEKAVIKKAIQKQKEKGNAN